MKRGEIWWASMEEPQSSAPGFRRPVIIISANEFNQSLIQTATVIIITSNLRLAAAPGNFKLTKKDSSLKRDSVANVSQVITVDKSFLTEKVGKLNARQINLLNDGLRLALNL